MQGKDDNSSLKKGRPAHFQIDESGRCLYSATLSKPFAAHDSRRAIRDPNSQAVFQQPAKRHATATAESASIHRTHPHELDDDWPPVRNWLWSTGVLAFFPISGIMDPGPIATAMLLPFVITVVVLYVALVLVVMLAILHRLLR